MGSTLTIAAPSDYALARDVCSYGYFLLAPNFWDVRTQTLSRPLELHEGVARVVLDQPKGNGAPVRTRTSRKLTRQEQAQARAQITRMLNLDDTSVTAFHKLDPRFKKSGRGRLFRSPTMFEDVIKTVTSCNVTWTSTIAMNQRLCEVFSSAFPRPTQLAKAKPETLRARCRVGYRDARIVELAKLFVSGNVNPAWYEDEANTDEEVYKQLLGLPGIGPYAAANIMQLLGRYAHLPLDSESVRHGKTVLGMTGTAGQINKELKSHYEPFGAHKFRSYWFELWDFYETAKGPAHTWDRETTGREFTASNLNKTGAAKKTRRKASKKTSKKTATKQRKKER